MGRNCLFAVRTYLFRVIQYARTPGRRRHLEATRRRRIPYHEVLGTGPTLVLAGGIHLDHVYLRPWIEPLASSARLVFFDHRATGRSVEAGNEEPGGLDHETWVEDIEWLRQAVDADRIVLFGHSYGSFLAQEYAAKYPDRLSGLILCAAAPAFDYTEVVLANAEAAGSPEMADVVRHAFGAPTPDDTTLQGLWKELLPLYFHDYDAELAARMDRRSTYSAAAFNRAFFDCLPGFSMVGRLTDLEMPVLLLAGRHDWICPPEQGALRMQRELPESELVIFEESGHFPFIEERDRFTAVVTRWLEALWET